MNSILKKINNFYKLANENIIHARLEGFPVMMEGFDENSNEDKEALKIIKNGLIFFRNNAKKYMPLLLKNIPELIFDFKSKEMHGKYFLTRDGKASVTIYASYLLKFGDSAVNRFAHAMAHELSHHIWESYLNQEARKDWNKIISEDMADLDLGKLLEQWPENIKYKDLNKVIKDNNILLQIDSYVQKYITNYKELNDEDDDIREQLQEMHEKGKISKVPVPKSPITGYANKDPEESFCEAIGLLIGYGPITLHPQIKRWLSKITEGKAKEISIANQYKNNFYKRAGHPINVSEDAIDKLADIMTNHLISVMRKQGKLFANNNVLGSLVIPWKNVKNEDINIQFILYAVTGSLENKKNGTIILGGGSGGVGNKLPNGNVPLVIKVNDAVTPEFLEIAYRDGVLKQDILEVLYHEITHAVDIIPEKERQTHHGNASTVFSATNSEEYFNLPSEVRAYLNQIARVNKKFIEKCISNGLSITQAIDKVLEEDFRWKQIEPFLTQKNKNKIYKGLWLYING